MQNTQKKPVILAIEDTDSIMVALQAAGAIRGCLIQSFPTVEAYNRFVQREEVQTNPRYQYPDYVILDYAISVGQAKNGMQVFQELKPKMPNTTWIMWSAMDSPREEAQRVGIKYYPKGGETNTALKLIDLLIEAYNNPDQL